MAATAYHIVKVVKCFRYLSLFTGVCFSRDTIFSPLNYCAQNASCLAVSMVTVRTSWIYNQIIL